MYFVRHNGGSVWFDQLGKPWPKHACFFDDLGGARLRVRLAEPVESGTRIFGVVAETEVTTPGERGRIVVRCSDGRVIDDEFNTSSDLTKYPGSLVVIDESDPGRYVLHRITPGKSVAEVYHCERFGQAVIYDSERQKGLQDLDTRMWMCADARWASHRTFHIWRLLSRIDGLTAARMVEEYHRVGTEPKNERTAAIFDAILHGRTLPKAVEVKVFPGTPYERRFELPATLTTQQIADWVRQIETFLGPRTVSYHDQQPSGEQP